MARTSLHEQALVAPSHMLDYINKIGISRNVALKPNLDIPIFILY